MKNPIVGILVCVVLAAAGIAYAQHQHTHSQPDLSNFGPCHIHGDLQDPDCTPGEKDPNVTQANIQQTICVKGYTKTVRPPTSYTTPLKMTLMGKYGFTDSPKNYELDHLISLELGGNPTSVQNLWPEPGASPNAKDKVEGR